MQSELSQTTEDANRRSPASGLLDGEPESWCKNHIRYVIGCRACFRANNRSTPKGKPERLASPSNDPSSPAAASGKK